LGSQSDSGFLILPGVLEMTEMPEEEKPASGGTGGMGGTDY
jgi:hypothetical protein